MEDHQDYSYPQGAELEESLEPTTDGLPTCTEALELDQKGSEELPVDMNKHLYDLPLDFHEQLAEDPGDHPRDFQHNASGSLEDLPWDFHKHLLHSSTDFSTKIHQLADEHRARGDLPKDSPLSLKVFPFKLSAPQVPCSAHVLKHLLKGQKIIEIYSTQSEEKDTASGTRTVIAEVPKKLIGYFSGNFIYDWTNLEIGPCSDSVSTFLIDWMKAGGHSPLKSAGAGAYQSKDLKWLEELYTSVHKLWIYKLLEQSAHDIDNLNGDNKKTEALQVEARQRALAVKEFTKQRDRAVHEAQKERFKEEAKVVGCVTAYLAWEITKWSGIVALFIIFSPGFGLIACMG